MDDNWDDDRAGDAEDVRWMTDAELGRARGISADSATRLAIRRKWRRQGGNDKTARVAIGETMPNPGKPTMMGVISGSDIARAIGALESALAELRDRAASAESRTNQAEIRATGAEQRADRAEGRATAAEARATALREQADVEAAALRSLIEAERGRADQAEREVTTLRDQIKAERDLATATHNQIAIEIESLRQRDRARRALGTWKRIRAAMRGE